MLLTVAADHETVVSVNGTEVGRLGALGAGTVPAPEDADPMPAAEPETLTIPAAVLVEGENVITIEIVADDSDPSVSRFDAQSVLIREQTP